MTLEKGKHIVKEIEGVRCTVVESGCSAERVAFLRGILEHNGLVVKSEAMPVKEVEGQPAPPATYIIGVTSIAFNPVIAVYGRTLMTRDGRRISPDYWNQRTDETEPNYWDLGKKRSDP